MDLTAKELRVGNYVQTDYEGLMQVVNINSEGFDYFDCVKPNFKGIGRYNIIQGIPITEELLLRFGFETWHKRDWDIGGVGNGQILTITTYLKNPLIRVEGQDLPQIKYVHQLQNLFYSLTNQELKLEGL
jgi:hypothetical protein